MSFKSTLYKKVSGTGKQTGNLFLQCNGCLIGVLDDNEEIDTSVVDIIKEFVTGVDDVTTRILEKNNYENLIISIRWKTDSWRTSFPRKNRGTVPFLFPLSKGYCTVKVPKREIFYLLFDTIKASLGRRVRGLKKLYILFNI